MNGFTAYEKLSKKKKREIDRLARRDWGIISPVTRKSDNPCAYRRSEGKIKSRNWSDDQGGAFFISYYPLTGVEICFIILIRSAKRKEGGCGLFGFRRRFGKTGYLTGLAALGKR